MALILQMLADKTLSKEELYQKVEDDFSLLQHVLEGVSSPKAAIRYGCSKVLMDLTEKHPTQIYPHMDFFMSLLDSKYRILTWNASAAIANLCSVDTQKKFDPNFERYFALLNSDYLITVANTVNNAAKIAQAKPYLIPKITNALLQVENLQLTPHLTAECKRIIAQTALDTFDSFFETLDPQDKTKVLTFAEKHKNSSRQKLQQKANLFLKKWN
ncbi:MAG: hypothetical protein NWF04_05680 [Candidatus Bathyarchaeota archaeon]|nr:hypothetical protein [Candidatus Bathyarchaeota archaeon]